MKNFKLILRNALFLSFLIVTQMANADNSRNEIPLDSNLNEKIVLIQDTDFFKTDLQTTIFKPNGPGPFPLVIFNHGHAEGSLKFGHLQQRERAIFFTREMLRKGYVVAIPMRKGYAGSGGGKPRDFTQQYEDVLTVARYMQNEKYIDKENLVIAGQSLGGYVSMMLANKKAMLPSLKTIINFAGGLPTTYNRKFEDELENISSPINIPSLWIYGDNDFLTSPEKLNKLERAYRTKNPKLKIVRTGEFKDSDAHFLMYNPDGVKLWKEEIEKFLSENDLPFKDVFTYEYRITSKERPQILAQDVAKQAIENLNSANKNQWDGYQKFKSITMSPKSFAISTINGRWGYSYGHDLTGEIALKLCEAKGIKCRLFAINDDIVEDPFNK